MSFTFLSSCVSRSSSKTQSAAEAPAIAPTTAVGTESTAESLVRPVLQDAAVRMDWPVDKARLSRGFLPRKRKPHYGIDLASARGTPIFAAAKGTVIYTGRDFRGYGNMILIESANEWATLYAHLDKIYVSEGQKIQRGETIGGMGRTGRATGTHLHFELRKNKTPVNPLVYLPAVDQVTTRVSKR